MGHTQLVEAVLKSSIVLLRSRARTTPTSTSRCFFAPSVIPPSVAFWLFSSAVSETLRSPRSDPVPWEVAVRHPDDAVRDLAALSPELIANAAIKHWAEIKSDKVTSGAALASSSLARGRGRHP